ncbi:DsbA family oxidoreductase [Paenibacillus koleovorans]|uniref:DsbA family oxidoreductase n=1 Tax=Paenibacillus koleovorans TaxID=121608 RepID=UPI000FD9C56C|nr:DsbA family oxidoreductase [Paenibacillus koleovorans]
MQIQVFSDTVCPWCRIGKQNLFAALEQWGQPFELQWRAFQLDPTTPKEGLPFRETMTKKFSGRADLPQLFNQVVQAGKASGVRFDFDRVEFMPNTLLSHQLIELMPGESQTAFVDAVFRAYFEEGQDIGRLEVLLQLAAEVGGDPEQLRARVATGEGEKQVQEDLAFARQVGISGVPFFILNNKYALSGAQPVSAFLQAFQQATDAAK